MKILQVIPYFYPAWAYGGPPRNAYEMAKKLVKGGHEVTIYTTDALDSKSRITKREERIDGIKVRRFRNLSNTLIYRYNISLPLGMLLAIREDLKNFDIIHMHEYRDLPNVFTYHYARKYGIPYVLQARGSLPRIMTKQKLKQIYDMLWGYKLLRDASKVIALTQMEVEQYRSMSIGQDKIEIVSNGIDLSEFENLPQRGEFRKKWSINGNQKIILFLGRIHKVKGLDLLAKAFAELPKEIDNAKLVIAGPDDGYLQALKRLIKELKIEERVLLTGPLYDRDKLEAYVDADVFVNPRADEIFGLVFLEAFACGTAVICSKGCGIADVIDNQAGLVIPYDKDALGNAILNILSDDKKRQKFGEKGRLLVREKFNWEKIAERVEGVYQAVINKG